MKKPEIVAAIEAALRIMVGLQMDTAPDSETLRQAIEDNRNARRALLEGVQIHGI